MIKGSTTILSAHVASPPVLKTLLLGADLAHKAGFTPAAEELLTLHSLAEKHHDLIYPEPKEVK